MAEQPSFQDILDEIMTDARQGCCGHRSTPCSAHLSVMEGVMKGLDASPFLRPGTCGGCKHWHPSSIGDLNDDGAIDVEDQEHWGWCTLIDLPDYGSAVTVTAFTKDGLNCQATLYTRSNHGCSLHERKETL